MTVNEDSDPLHYADIYVNRDVPVRMRDGTILYADVWRPRATGRFPVLIERTPYGPDSPERVLGAGEYLARRGYVVVIQDVRGRYRSPGRFSPFASEGWGVNKDGYDTIEWAAKQPWSNGKVATIGGSYSGVTQYMAAATRPPHLVCQVAREAPSSFFRQWVYRGGAFELAFNTEWALRHTADQRHRFPEDDRSDEAYRALTASYCEDLESWFGHLPIHPLPPLRDLALWHSEFLGHAVDGPYWRQWAVSDQYARFGVPILHVGGWFDIFLQGTIDNYVGIRETAESPTVRDTQRLLIGPWTHGAKEMTRSVAGDQDFGQDAAVDALAYRMPWLDHWMKGESSAEMDEPPVKIFTMGTNRWQSFDTWPPRRARAVRWYLRSGSSGSARSLNDGSLSLERPDVNEPPDEFTYDPADPIPTLGGNTLGIPSGPMDQRPVEERCLTYTSAPLDRDIEVTGPVTATVFGLSSAPDTDWVVRLSDVHSDGRSMPVCDGILRARFRESWTEPKLLDGTVQRFDVDLWATSNVFRRGHRLRVAVTSSSFPRWDRNLNTGGENALASAGVDAVNSVFHDAQHPSFIEVSVV